MGNTRNLFLNNDVTCKNPFNIFTDWYENANQICDANSMYLTTVSKINTPSCRITTCIKFSKDGFQFPVTDSSQTSLDLKENVNAALAFIWPQNRAVRIDGVAKVSEDNDDYAQKLAYNSKIIATCSKVQQTFQSRESLMKSLDNLKLKYPPNSNFDCNISVFILIPETIEFYQSKKGKMQERLQFKRGMDVDNKLVYKAEEEWTYTVLSP